MAQLSICSMLLLYGGTLGAPDDDTMAVSARVQAVFFKKIFVYNETLKVKAAGGASVLVAHAPGKTDVSKLMVSAFRLAGVKAQAVADNALADKMADDTVVYLAPGVSPGPIKELCASKGVLSITGVAALVELGDAAVGVSATEDGRPQILVHFARLKIEGQELNARLLGLARIIR